MRRIRNLLFQISPVRSLAEGGLVCIVLLLPMLPILLETTPQVLSLYLVLLPLVCAVWLGLRQRFFSGTPGWVVLQEIALALGIGLVVWGTVFGLLTALGHFDAIRYSYAGVAGTRFFLLLSALEYLGVRGGIWGWRAWGRLRRRRYVWALTHAILCVGMGVGMLVLIGVIAYFVTLFGNDIWGVPPESTFARAVFWATLVVFLSFVLFTATLVLVLPPAALFSFLLARKMTVRLENLAAVTRELRKGDLAIRVAVNGEDEIAQLQTNLNAMAADLQKSMLALQDEKDKVWRLLEARRELVDGISHELRNPAAIIQGYSSALVQAWQDRPVEEVQHDLATIQYETARLQIILDDLLTASQAELGRLHVVLRPVEVTALVRRVVETLAGLAWMSKRVQVTLTVPPRTIFALADPLRLEQALVNLVQNALRHTSPGGLVMLEVCPGLEQICIEVEDTGEGILPEDLPHIWEKYYQSSLPQRRSGYGMGLGLSLVKELTEAMGGSVAVESWPGQGSLFQIHLPACDSVENTP